MVAREGHIAIIIPNFAKQPVRFQEIRIYEYRGEHEWLDRTAAEAPGYFYTGRRGCSCQIQQVRQFLIREFRHELRV
jgi:hypothetical protein